MFLASTAAVLACILFWYRNSIFPAYRNGRIETIEYAFVACLSTALIALQSNSWVWNQVRRFLGHRIASLFLPLVLFPSVYFLAMYQFGGFDESEVAHAAAYFSEGLQPYVDFPVTMPPFFMAGIHISVVILGLKWSSQAILSATFSAVTSLWLFATLRFARTSLDWAVLLTLVVELSTMFIAPFWWFNNTTSVAAVLLLASTFACLFSSNRIFPWVSLSFALALILTAKPNAAPVCLTVLILFPALPRPNWNRIIISLVSASAIALGICRIAGATAAQIVSSYSEISKLRGNPIAAFAYQQMDAVAVVVEASIVGFCTLVFFDLLIRSFARGRTAWPTAFICLIAGVTSIFMDLMNAENKVTDLILLVMAAAFLILAPSKSQPSDPRSHRYLAGLLTVVATMSMFFGVTHLRILTIGEGAFYEPLPTKPIQSGYFAGLQAAPRLQNVIDETRNVLDTYPSGTVFFGPRMEFEYPVFQKKPMRGMPLIWDAGVTFSPERLPNMIQSFKAQDPDLLIFLKGDYTRMGIMADYIKNSSKYQRIETFRTLTVYVRKR